jgi:DNA-binding IclR family transcriptional regulator
MSSEMRVPANANGGGIQVISRAAQILRALDGSPDGLSLSQLADRAGLPRSTVHRLTTALAVEGLVTAASPTARVRLGPELTRLAIGARREIRQELRPYMQQLFERLGETVDMAILDGDHLVFVDQIAAPHRLRAVSAVGARFPLHCTANGKALLAALPEDVVRDTLPSQLERYTEQTTTQRPELMAELDSIREGGVAFDREEHTEGICAGGIAVIDAFGALAALSVPMPMQRFYGREDEIATELLVTRQAALADLGTAEV